MHGVRRLHVARRQELDIGRKSISTHELLRAERERHCRQALFRHAGVVGVDRSNTGLLGLGPPQLVGCSADDVRGVVGGREEEFPSFGDPVAGIGGEKPVQRRRARARCADHEDGLHDAFGGDRRVFRKGRVDGIRTVDEALKESVGERTSGGGQPGIVLEPGPNEREFVRSRSWRHVRNRQRRCAWRAASSPARSSGVTEVVEAGR